MKKLYSKRRFQCPVAISEKNMLYMHQGMSVTELVN